MSVEQFFSFLDAEAVDELREVGMEGLADDGGYVTCLDAEFFCESFSGASVVAVFLVVVHGGEKFLLEFIHKLCVDDATATILLVSFVRNAMLVHISSRRWYATRHPTLQPCKGRYDSCNKQMFLKQKGTAGHKLEVLYQIVK